MQKEEVSQKICGKIEQMLKEKKSEEKYLKPNLKNLKKKKKKKSRFHQGEFSPKNPNKYIGKYPIIYRSGWELKAMKYFDQHPSVITWTSETIFIPYYNIIKKRMARYFPDFTVKIKDRGGIMKHWLVEIKPLKETKPPIQKKGRRKTTVLYETSTFLINKAKWDAAKIWCAKKGLEFIIITEKQLFPHRNK